MRRFLVFVVPVVVAGLGISYLTTRGELSVSMTLALGAGILAAAALFYASYAFTAGAPVRIHDDGFVVERRRGELAVRWDDVDAYYVDYEVDRVTGQPTSVAYTVVTFAGDEIRFGRGLVEAGLLDDIFTTRVSRKLLPDARRALADGQALRFGEFSITTVGLARGTESIAWTDVETIEATPTKVYVRRHGAKLEWTVFPLAKIAHPWLFLALARERTKVTDVNR